MSQFIPVFEPSGRGLTADFMEIKKNEMLSAGWYKGQLASLLTDLAGRRWIDGILVYGNSFSVRDATRNRKVDRFLELLGFDDSGLSQIYSTARQGRVDDVRYRFKQKYTYTQNDFDFAYDELLKAISNVHKIVETNSNFIYRESNYPASGSRIAKSANQIYGSFGQSRDHNIYAGFEWWQEDEEENGIFPWTGAGDTGFADSRIANDYISLKLYDSLNVDITDDYPSFILNCLRTMLTISGTSFMDLDTLVKTGESRIEITSGGSEPTSEYYWIVSSQSTYILPKKQDFKNTYGRYKLGNDDLYRGVFRSVGDGDLELQQTNRYSNYHLNNYWIMRESLVLEGALDKNFVSLFYQQYSQYYSTTSSLNTNPVYMKVEGLKKANPNLLSYSLSQYSDIQVIQAKKKGFGGGFLGSIVGGIINGIVSIISAIAGLVFEIPILREFAQIVFSLFGVDANSKEKFKAAFTRVAMFVIAIVIAWYGGPEGWKLAIAILSTIASTYMLVTGMNDLSEQFEYQDKMQRIQDDKNALKEEIEEDNNNKTTSVADIESVNDFMYDGMFNLSDSLNNIYDNPYDSGGQFDLKFGMG